MKLKRLIVKHFGVFQGKHAFDLDDDLVVVYGNNFSGKTTLTRALYFALSGKSPLNRVQPKSLAHLHESSATAGIVFARQENTYRLYRSTKGDVKQEIRQAEQWEELADGIEVLPELNPWQWKQGCFLQEDELGEFLSHTPAKRRDLLNQLLGIEQLLSVQTVFIGARRLAKRIEKNALNAQSHAGDFFDTGNDDELRRCRTDIASLERQLHAVKEQSGNHELYREWTAQYEQLRAHVDALQADYDEVRAGFEDSAELLKTLEELRGQLSEAERYSGDVECLTESRITLAAELQRLEELRASIQQLEGLKLCPTCQQELAPRHVQYLSTLYQQQSDELKLQLEQAVSEENDARETVELVRELREQESDLSLRHGKCVILERESADTHSQLEILQKKLDAFSEAAANEEHIGFLETELQEKQTRLKELEWQHFRMQELRDQAEKAEREIKSATRQRLLSEWAADAVQQTLQTIIGDSLQGVEASVLDCLREFELLSDSDRSLELEKSGLMPELDGRKFQMLSGSEKAILYIGMKLAISQLMPGADFVVLDNPTLHLDDMRRERMREYVLGLLARKQVIVFTNDGIFADSFSQGKRIDLP